MKSARSSTDDLPGLVPSPLSFPVVGIGGSAGGLQALLRFFQNMPADPGMAFVVILHLARDHESNAAAILQRVTSMPVAQVASSVPIEPNHVYVIAPGADLSMNDGHLEVSDLRPGPAVAIDVFFRTLAQVHASRAICVVLSGTGSDGAVGLTRVKEVGGITMAQTPEDAEHDDMPRAAIATERVDIVLPAAAMGAKLVELWANAQQIHLPGMAAPLQDEAATTQPPPERADAQVLQEIMMLLRTYTRHDFRHYKPGTVLRRVERRLQVNGLPDLASYREYLQVNPREAGPLLQDMLISVTNFFRDQGAFEALAHDVIPRLFRDRAADDQVRVWVAGCATGEESYSVSMLLHEHEEFRANSEHADYQIFATDIDERAIAAARRGVYPVGIAADLSPARIQRFMVKEQDQFRVTAAVRERVLFATHNLLRDPPFSRLDLICCRNLLIYLDQSAQASVLEMFRYALKPGGYLFLGTSESVDTAGNLFTSVDKKNRIFRVDASTPARGHAAYLTDRSAHSLPLARWSAPEIERTPPQSFPAQQHLQALEAISPASVLIDDEHDVLHLSPTAARFMERNAGVPSNNLLNNVEPDLRLELRTALFQAAQTGKKVTTRVRQVQADGTRSALDIEVHPIFDGEHASKRTLVVFNEAGQELDASMGETGAVDATQHLMLGKLEEDNRQLKVHLQDTLERSALSNEELKASNEELQAINEELRSATEELETSKEELQSMNEELGTVNIELRTKVEERGRINDDLQNLISSSGIATVFVDSGMRIKRFTPQASKLFSLIASDIGRSLLDITNRLNYGELATDAETVFSDLSVIERQITTTDHRRFFARILPYRTVDDKIGGAVLTFIDVTELRAAEAQVLASEERLRVAAASTSDFAIITTDEQGAIETWNTGAERVFGYSSDEALGRPVAMIFTEKDRTAGLPEAEMRLALESGRAEEEGWRQRKDGSTVYCSGVMTRLQTSAGKGFAKIARDLTGSKRQELAQENLLLKEQRTSLDARHAMELKDRFLAVMSHELKQPLNVIQVSAELLTRLPETREIVSAVRIGDAIQRAVSSQSKIIDDLLDLSRIRTGKMHLDVLPIDLSELIRSLAQAASSDCTAKGLRLTVDNTDGVICHCDRVRAEQILWNLIANAVKFTPSHGEVRLSLSVEDTHAKISVADTGKGVAAEFLPSIFDMFNQAGVRATSANGGLGIGLALVKELTQAHKGRVEASSAGVDQGACFTVYLPLSAHDTMVAERPRPQVDQLRGMRILTVDDDPESLEMLAQILRLEGATVDTATSARLALSLISKGRYDLLVSDVSMPSMDGYAFIAEVRRAWPALALRAIALSGYGRAVDVSNARAAGFDAHLSKPASVEDLKSVLAELATGTPRLPMVEVAD
jgi:two-component system CheB/CheR fusion protein